MPLNYHYVLPGTGPLDSAAVREMFDDIKAYVDTLAPISGAAPSSSQYVTLALDAGLTSERVLTGTSNQVIITDNGAGSTVVLSLPQSIANTSSPTFAGLLLRNSGGDIVTINPSSSAFTPYTLTLPLNDGDSGQFLQTNGSGVLTWAAVTTGVTSAQGTVKQVLVNGTSGSPQTGAITLSLPQAIATDSDVSFASVTVTPGAVTSTRFVSTTVGDGTNPTITIFDSNTGFWRENTKLQLSFLGTVYTTWDTSGTKITVPNLFAQNASVYELILNGPSGGGGAVTLTTSLISDDYTLTLPENNGTPNQVLTTDGSGILSWQNVSAVGGANTALSNLASVAINTTLVSDTNNTDDLGSSSIRWKDLYLSSTLNNSATTNQIVLGTTRTVTLTAPTPATSSRTYTFPDMTADYSVVATEGTQTINGAKTLGSVILFAAGTSNAPNAFSGDTNTGFYSAVADSIGFAVGGNGNNHLEIRQNGEVSISVLDSGRSAFGKLYIDGTQVGFQDGSNTAPAITFTGDLNNGLYRIGTDNWAMAAAGVKVWETSAAGEITQPTQPSFLVTNSAGATDVTGDATVYTVLWGNEIYDQGSDFTSNTFTAPITGRYLLTATINVTNMLVSHNGRALKIITSNRNYTNDYNALLAETDRTMLVTAIADMDAGDTATVTLDVSGSTKTVDINANGTLNYFSGSLIN